MSSSYDKGLADLALDRRQQGAKWLRERMRTCGHEMGANAFLCPYDESPLLRCPACAEPHLLEHTPDRCELCHKNAPDPLCRMQQEWETTGTLVVTMPTVALCDGCAPDALSYRPRTPGLGSRTMESVDNVLRVLRGDQSVFPVRCCHHVIPMLLEVGDGPRPDGALRMCGFHAPMGLMCTECWYSHLANHHNNRDLPNCHECGAEEGGIYMAGVHVPVPHAVRIESSYGERAGGWLDGGRVRVEPRAYLCGVCRDGAEKG